MTRKKQALGKIKNHLKSKDFNLLKFLQIELFERYLLIETFLFLNIIRFSFLWMQFSLVKKFLNALSRLLPCNSKHIAIDQIIWTVDISTKFSLGEARCLARAFTTQVMMQRYGYDSQLRIGIMKDPNKNQFQAHAWIEYEGKVVIGMLPDLDAFEVLLPYQVYSPSKTL